jgi:hypothetical protein
MVRKTRKIKQSKKSPPKTMTIPQLRKSFEHIENFINTKGYDIAAFRKEWKKTFGREVSEKAAKEYLDFLQINKKKGGSEMKGGAAPLDYVMRPGVDLPHGNFPNYVSSGFGVGVPQDSFRAQCGKENITPMIPATLGSNAVQKGGRKTRKSKKQKGGASLGSSLASVMGEVLSRPFGMSSPVTTAQDLQMQGKGVLPQPSGDPSQATFSYTTPQTVYSAQASSASRTF